VRDLRQNVRLVFMDSHWFLREPTEAARTEFFEDLKETLKTAGDREVIMMTHHPFATAGPHGIAASSGRSFGYLYLLQKSGTLVQDLNSPAYGSFRDRMRLTFSETGEVPLVFAGGHDHSLQVLDGLRPGDPRNILVSGSASKVTTLGDTIGLRYGAERPGYMSLVFRKDDTVDLFVTAGDPGHLQCPASPEQERVDCMSAGVDSFQIAYSESLPVEKPPVQVTEDGEEVEPRDTAEARKQQQDTTEEKKADEGSTPRAVPLGVLNQTRDSVVASPGQTYRANAFERLVMGTLNRDLWEIEFKLPVLDLDSVGGGLTPTELSGGEQTLGLRLRGRDGLTYQFRSIVKDPTRALPDMLESGPIRGAVEDQQAAQFPLGASVVAELLLAAGVLVAKPTAVIMPDDPRLGEFREQFAGRMGWIEMRPEERDDDQPGFAGSRKVEGTAELFLELSEEPEARINEREFLRARLIDMFVNDWDRHADNWRWASFPEGNRERWDPVPRDRDWALSRVDGLLPRIAGMFYPKYVGFRDEYPAVGRLMWSGSVIDRRLLGGVDRAAYREEVAELQRIFSDSVIDAAIHALPPEYLAQEGKRLRSALLARRESLARVTDEYYMLLAGWVDLYGTTEPDSIDMAVGADTVTVRLWRGEARLPGFTRTFHKEETRELRLYVMSGRDVVTVHGEAAFPMKVCIVGEPGSVELLRPSGTTTLVAEGNVPLSHNLAFHEATPTSGRGAMAQAGDGEEPELREGPTFAWEWRDWGSQWLVHPAVDYQSEFGLHLGAKASRIGFGFEGDPHDSRLDVTVLGSTNPRRLVGEVQYEKRLNKNGLSARVDVEAYTHRHSRFFGLGNETTDNAPEEHFRAFRSYNGLDASLVYQSPRETWSVWAGPRIVRWGKLDVMAESVIFDTVSVYGSDAFAEFGLQTGLEVDARDEKDNPSKGVLLLVEGRVFPETGNLRAAHGGLRGTFGSYLDLPGPLDPVLHVRLYGERIWGDAPFPDMASLGGRRSLPGYRTERYIGDSAASLSSLLRFNLFRIGGAGGVGVGAFGLGSMGRVWLDHVQEAGTIHRAWGGGLFLRSDELRRSVSISWAVGDSGTRTYLGLGLPF
jgi:hypothetical protein